MATRERDYFFDNAKFFLMLLVVLGHAMEFAKGGLSSIVYKLIYLFHMPAFVFVAGHFSAKQRQAKIGDLALQYLLFQTIYLVTDGLLFRGEIDLQYTRPYWILWFTLAVIIWKVFSPYVAKIPPAVCVGILVVAAVLVGYNETVGYDLSLSRAVVFFPFFMLGHWMGSPALAKLQKIPSWVGILAFLLSFVLLWQVVDLPLGLLYRSMPYEDMGLHGWRAGASRLGVMLWGTALVAAFLSLIPTRQTVFSALGARTLQAFYLHGIALCCLRAVLPQALFSLLWARVVFYLLVLAGTVLLLTRPVELACRPLMHPQEVLVGVWRRVTGHV